MQKYKVYLTKNKKITEALLGNNIVLVTDRQIKEKACGLIKCEYHKEKYTVCVVSDNYRLKTKITNILVENHLKNYSFQNLYFTNCRFNIKENIYISNNLNIYMHYLNKKDKNVLILNHFFKLKDIIKKYGKEKVLMNYKYYHHNNTVLSLQKKVTISFDDYFYLGDIKKIIRLYKKEVSTNIDINDPDLTDEMILNYLDNYYSKLIVISYDEAKIKNFIIKYYQTNVQAEDKIYPFINSLVYIYNLLNNTNIEYDNYYNSKYKLINSKVKKYHDKKTNKIIDDIFSNEENYYNIISIFDNILEIKKQCNTGKMIVDYVTVLEQLLTHSPKNDKTDTISKQFITKIDICLNRINNKEYSNKELREIYTYRSKMTHGEYMLLQKCLKRLSKMDIYIINQAILEEEIYSTELQLVEEKLKERVEELFKIMFKMFLTENKYINDLKQQIMSK